MTSTWDSMKSRTKRLSDSFLNRGHRDLRDIQFADMSAPIVMNLDGNELVYENQLWRLESVDGTTLNKKTTHLKEENRRLHEENQLLKFKLEILTDMLATSNLDALQLQKEKEQLLDNVNNQSDSH